MRRLPLRPHADQDRAGARQCFRERARNLVCFEGGLRIVRQKTLFETTSPAEVNKTESPADDAKRQHNNSVDVGVRPALNLAVRKTCAYCGHELGAAGCSIIPDFEELGSFCSQECGDRRFRSYLANEA